MMICEEFECSIENFSSNDLVLGLFIPFFMLLYTIIKNIWHTYTSGLLQAGGLFLRKQLALTQPGGQIKPTTVLRAPSDFQTL